MSLRKKHTPKFKSKVAIEALKGLKTAAEIASDNGVHPAMVSQWKKTAADILEAGFADKRGSTRKEPVGFEKDQLLAQIGQLKVELNRLKKGSRGACDATKAAD